MYHQFIYYLQQYIMLEWLKTSKRSSGGPVLREIQQYYHSTALLSGNQGYDGDPVYTSLAREVATKPRDEAAYLGGLFYPDSYFE